MTYNQTLSKIEHIHRQTLSKAEQSMKRLCLVEYPNKNLPQVVHIAKICLRSETRPNLFQIERTARITLSVAVNIRPKHTYIHTQTFSCRTHDKNHFQVEHTTKNILRSHTRPKSFSGRARHQKGRGSKHYRKTEVITE